MYEGFLTHNATWNTKTGIYSKCYVAKVHWRKTASVGGFCQVLHKPNQAGEHTSVNYNKSNMEDIKQLKDYGYTRRATTYVFTKERSIAI